MSNLRLFNGATQEPYKSEVMLEMAKNAGLESVVIVGFDEGGDLFVSATSLRADEVYWALHKAAQQILNGDFEAL